MGETVSVTFVDADSSSAIVRVTSCGAVTPSVFTTTPDTVTCRLSSSAVLLTAEIVTVPVLVVAPAAMVSVLSLLSVKSLAVAGSTADADTVIVVSAVDDLSRVAVTVLTPSFSLMTSGSRNRVARRCGFTILTATWPPSDQPRSAAVTPHHTTSLPRLRAASAKSNVWLPTCNTQLASEEPQPPYRETRLRADLFGAVQAPALGLMPKKFM